jgi:hypothetical protein
MSSSSVYWPERVRVETGAGGEPAAVDSVAVDAVREEWLVEDRWWTPKPLRRRYFELVLVDGRNVVVFREQAKEGERWHGSDRDATGGSDATMPCPADAGRWFLQRA